MNRVQVLLEDHQQAFLSAFAKRNGTNVSQTVRQLVDEKIARHKEEELSLAADALAEMYSTNSELTAFTALDGEDWAE